MRSIGIFLIGIVLILIGVNQCMTLVTNVTYDMDTIDGFIFSSPIIIGQDTLDVVSTSWLHQTVTLENGVEYDYKYVENKFLDKTVKQRIDSLNNSK